MTRECSWPRLPALRVEIEAEEPLGPAARAGFVRLRRLRVRNVDGHGAIGPAYTYDVAERTALDAVALVLFARGAAGALEVCLRSCIRPPILLRAGAAVPLPEHDPSAVLWEIPAGLVEPGERGDAGLRACASREALEETGCRVAPATWRPLGPPYYLSPGVMAEKVHAFAAEVEPSLRVEPVGDGSPSEAGAAVGFVPLEAALGALDDGTIADAKTEVALRRFAAQVAGVRP